MFEQIWSDLSGSVESVVSSKDWVVLGIMAVAALAVGLTMPKWTSVFGRAGQGLLLVALALFLWDVLDNENRFAWSNWDAEGKESWMELMAMTVKTLVGYYAVMLVGVAVIHGVKSVVQR
ncbi:hypothetical protein [Parvularcula marina]|jgi:hypothetical protein|uniref:Uncharacterized protein n=1 Tax=Parvularcula marina TaxID=2292771 RepID=A0A371R844_9PROT|nr:hypothetical protein [Parvularcula marina]RFB01610.1 hypothetical protein DX908_15130 [Parvularcula marina]